MAANISNNTFYLAFKDVHPSWSLIGCALTYGIITTFGVIFNSSVIVATYLTKSFRGTVNFLLVLYSFFELVHQLGHFLLVYNAFSGQNFIVIHLEAKILFIPVIGLGGITPAMFFTGIDRLIGIAFSEFHDNLKKRLYLALLAILSVSYGLCFSISVYQNAIMDGDQMTTGAYFDFLRISPIFLTTNLLLTSMTCIIYLLLGIAVHIKASGLPSADSFNRRTFRALFCIISFYLAFKDVHPSWSLIGCALTYGIITTFGVIFNSSIIVVTFLTKSFRGTVNYLLALCSFFESLFQLGHFLFVYTAFSGQNFIVYRLAAKILFIPVIGLGAIAPAMFFTGIDRLIGIAFSEFHDNLKKRLYLALLTVISVSYGFCLSVSEYQSAISDGDQMITGSYVDFLKSSTILNTISLLLTSMNFINYLLLGIAVCTKASGLPSADSINRRTFRALFCITTVNIGGYFFSLICYILLIPTISSPITAWFCIAIIAIPLNIGAASSGPILYFTSTEYRQAFQTEFPFVFKQSSNQNQVIPLQNVVVPMRTTMRS
ncbi:hypothetical protein niasHS_003037 [Heterodera schachtii]|uniref:G protein-coupled receptor n=1 Tax=Heterodera schachtii TaxID=97005 RepID=A0ABD2K9R2_HETSC